MHGALIIHNWTFDDSRLSGKVSLIDIWNFETVRIASSTFSNGKGQRFLLFQVVKEVYIGHCHFYNAIASNNNVRCMKMDNVTMALVEHSSFTHCHSWTSGGAVQIVNPKKTSIIKYCSFTKKHSETNWWCYLSQY